MPRPAMFTGRVQASLRYMRRVLGLGPDLERDRWRGGREERVDIGQDLVELGLDQGADLLGLEVVRVVVTADKA